MNIQVTLDIPDQRIKDLLCSAFEGGSNYWIKKIQYPPRKQWPDGVQYFHELPVEGGYIEIFSTGEETDNGKSKKYLLNQDAIRRGMTVFTNTEPKHHLCNFLKEDDDAETADVFLQCCLFGKTILS